MHILGHLFLIFMTALCSISPFMLYLFLPFDSFQNIFAVFAWLLPFIVAVLITIFGDYVGGEVYGGTVCLFAAFFTWGLAGVSEHDHLAHSLWGVCVLFGLTFSCLGIRFLVRGMEPLLPRS